MAENKFDRQVQELLANAGATLVRNKNHNIYRFPSGQVLPMSQTPSDWRCGRKRITALKHAIAKEQALAGQPARTAAIPVPISREPRKRMTVPNRPARGPIGEIQLPKLEPSLPKIPRGATQTPFESLLELQQHLANVDAFWELTPGGRARTLLKVLPAHLQAEPVPMQFCRATSVEIDNLFTKSGKSYRKSQKLLMSRLMERMNYTCGSAYYPALLLHDPEDGDLLVDLVSLSMLVDVFEDIQIFDVEASDEFIFADAPLITYEGAGDDEVDFVVAISPEFARSNYIHFQTDQGWTNPAAIRHVVQALRERNNPNYVPKSYPVLPEKLTPFEEFQKTALPYFEDVSDVREYLNETNWIVTTLVLNPEDPIGNAEALDWVGRIFAYAFGRDGRHMVRVLDEYIVELWFSFLEEKHKTGFLEDVREDGYCDPDDEICGFKPPATLDSLPELVPPITVFDPDQYARIHSSMCTEPKLQSKLSEMMDLWREM